MPPAFIYFDLGNVLFAFDRDRAFRQMAAVCDADPEVVRRCVMDEGLQHDLEHGLIDWAGFHDAFSRRTGTTSAADALALAASDMFTLRHDMLPVIAALTRAGVPMGILSNTCGPHWDHLVAGRYAILPGRFAPIVLSHEVRSLKPAAPIYAEAVRRAGVPAAAIFFCDDRPENVAGAVAAGWDAVLFTTAAGLVDDLARRGVNLGL